MSVLDGLPPATFPGRVRRLLGRPAPGGRRADPSLSLDAWAEMFTFGGAGYGFFPSQTLGVGEERIDGGFFGYVQGAYKGNGVVFACIVARMLLFSEAAFRFQQIRDGRPGRLFGTPALRLLEEPWAGGTTGDLLSRAITDVDLGGNFFAALIDGQLRRLRPDWVTIVAGSRSGADGGSWAPDVELIGYVFHPGGPNSGKTGIPFLPNEVLHWAPIPDPGYQFRGMSWLTPVLHEVMADGAATRHKKAFFENGATVNMVVSLDPAISPENFEKWVALFEKDHRGAENAYKTLFLGGGADVKPVGADMRQLDFAAVQGHGETRVCAAARVPPIIVGLSEGLESATYSNYGQARRAFSDGTMRPLWRSFAGAASAVMQVPAGARLWYDDRDVPFLQEDLRDAAQIQNLEAQTIANLIREGYEPESVVAAVENANWSLLKHSGLISVQLHSPGDEPAPAAGEDTPDASTGAGAAESAPSANGNGAAAGRASLTGRG